MLLILSIMVLILSLIVLGVFLLIVELLLLPGITLAGIAALLCFVGAVFYAYTTIGAIGGSITLTIIIFLSLLAVVISLRSNTWRRFSLQSKVSSRSNRTPEQENIEVGQVGEAITRLAPMGKVRFGDKIIEAKSIDSYIDQKKIVEVIGFDNTSVIVKIKH